MKLNISVLNIILVFVISLFFVEKTFAQTGCEGCTITNPTGGDNATLTVNVGDVICFTQDRTFGDLIIDGGTICIAEDVKVTIINNVSTTIGTNINLEIYGTLQFNQVTTMKATVNANIYSKGVLRSGDKGGNNFNFDGVGINVINNYGLIDMGTLTFSNIDGTYHFDNFNQMNLTGNINIEAKTTKFKNNPGGVMNIGAQFGMNKGAAFYNCGTITTKAGFNMGGGHIINTGSFTVNGNINYEMSSVRIDNYGTFNVNNGYIQMQADAVFYNEGVTIISNGTFERGGHILGPEDGLGKLGYIYFDQVAIMNNGSIGPNINFKNTAKNGTSSFAVMFQNSNSTNLIKKTGVSWDCESTGTCAAPKQTFLDLCTDFEGNFPRRYWTGIDSEDFGTSSNWTTKIIPLDGEDVEFATDDNNGPTGDGDKTGAAVRDLHLDKDRIIGDLINKSDKDLIVTTERQLIINGKVKDDNTGGIVVKAVADAAMGTLKFADPAKNSNVAATVQFYNKAYECDNCGFYRKQWQYFGVPVQSGAFPFANVAGKETVNMWDETFNGNKWRPMSGALSAFKGYQITNDAKTEPTGVYNFAGKLNVGDATVALTKTANVNYSGTNLVSNSYTAAIPISADAMTFPAGVEETVYLFNTGTRDQWRKLNGSAINQAGYKSGQYLAVPMNLGGTSNFPDRIPSTHSFMLLAKNTGTLKINYSTLIKNTSVNRGDGTQITTRSVDNNNKTSVSEQVNTIEQLPSLVMDVIGEESADRLWIFQKEGTSHNFNNGWDGRKMLEDGIAQLYVNATDESKLQVATVPELDSLSLGFIADFDGKYTFEFAQKGKLKGTDIYLHDAVTGTTQQVGDGQSYSFTAKRGEAGNRFSLSSKDNSAFLSVDESLVEVSATSDGEIKIVNSSSRTVSAFVYNIAGVFVKRVEVKDNSESVLSNIAKGEHIVRLQNSNLNDVRRVAVE